MLFNSFNFLIFLPVVFIGYWLFYKNFKLQNILLLISSYIFYGWWDYRFLSLIMLSTLVDYFVGLQIFKSNKQGLKTTWLWISITFNMGILGFFKYYNFFIESWIESLKLLGYHTENNWTLKVILPVGISFYTFQTVSYSIDIYKKKLPATKDLLLLQRLFLFSPSW